MAMNRDVPPDLIKSDETLLGIIETLQELDGARLTEIENHLDLHKSTVYRHLLTLDHHGYINKEQDEYFLGYKFLNIGGYVQNRKAEFTEVGQKVRDLALETGELAQFITEDNGLGVFVFRERGDDAVQTESRLGTITYLHHTSAGKAILSQLPPNQVEEIIEKHGLPEKTNHTISEKSELFDELETCRDRGYAIDTEEHIEGLTAIGAPIKTSRDRVLGGVSVAGPTHRMKGEWFDEELPNLILGVTNEIELNITYS